MKLRLSVNISYLLTGCGGGHRLDYEFHFHINQELRNTMAGEKTLQSLAAGENAFVVAVAAGFKARTRLESMGIIPGACVDVVANSNGPMIVSVGEGRVMVERGIAEKVIVA